MIYLVTRKIVITEEYVVEAESEHQAKSKITIDASPTAVNHKHCPPEIEKTIDEDEGEEFLENYFPPDWTPDMIERAIEK